MLANGYCMTNHNSVTQHLPCPRLITTTRRRRYGILWSSEAWSPDTKRTKHSAASRPDGFFSQSAMKSRESGTLKPNKFPIKIPLYDQFLSNCCKRLVSPKYLSPSVKRRCLPGRKRLAQLPYLCFSQRRTEGGNFFSINSSKKEGNLICRDWMRRGRVCLLSA